MYGINPYSSTSQLGMAAKHACGEDFPMTVELVKVAPLTSYTASTRNGVTTKALTSSTSDSMSLI